MKGKIMINDSLKSIGIRPNYPLFVANKQIVTKTSFPVYDKFTGKVKNIFQLIHFQIATQSSLANKEIIDEAISKGISAEHSMKVNMNQL